MVKYDEYEQNQFNKDTFIWVNSVKHLGNLINNYLCRIDDYKIIKSLLY